MSFLQKIFNNKSENKKNIKEYLNKINETADEIFLLQEPQVFTMAKENNIACKYKQDYLVTKDGNLVIGFEIRGTSYAGVSLEDELNLLQNRIDFFNSLSSNYEVTIVMQKELIDQEKNQIEVKNFYAKQITDRWNLKQKIYLVKYYIFVSTIKKNITGFLESFKTKTTSEDAQTSNQIFSNNLKNLEEVSNNISSRLSIFKPIKLNADEIINFYASYANATPTRLKYTSELLTDSYLNSDVEFKKDYILFNTNEGKQIYARFLSVKAYETEAIKSLITTNTLQNKNEFTIFIHLKAYDKQKAIKKIKDTRAFSVVAVQEELDNLIEQVKSDRENLIQASYSVYLKAESIEELNEKSNEIKNILTNQGLNVVRETLNQKALYFSFYPSRGNLNARKKSLKTSNIATIINYENEVRGFNRNDWGEEAVTTFKHINGTPFLFNFHSQSFGDRPAGHTMIIGGTGTGKTTLAQFLMTNLFKYNIDIFSMDKLRGMYTFATFLDGEYHDSESEEFKLNPFSLSDTQDNILFLQNFLSIMAEVKDDEHDAISEISKTIDRLYKTKKEDQILSLDNFIESLPANDTTKLKKRFENYKKSIFNNQEDALNFKKQLSILNMDAILNNHKLSGLTAMYVFHKLKTEAKNATSKRGFFCFIDELKDYLNDTTMREKILEAILEVRKIGGVMCFGFQNLSIFKEIEKGSSFLDNIANFIIYPTSNEQTIEEMTDMIGLTPSEAKFLKNTNPNERKVLLKMKLRQESAILDVDISRLNKYIKIFSSSSNNVMKLKELKEQNPKEFKELFLQLD